MHENAVQLVHDYDIATPTVDTPVRMLSGGNLQKVILARETAECPQLMVAVHPTRGLDVGATETVQRSAAIVNETRVLFMASSITSACVKTYQCETDVAGTRAPEAIQC